MYKVTVILLFVVFGSCATVQRPSYLSDIYIVCHKKFRNGQWYPQQLKLSAGVVYRDHIGWHPNDYWGRCKEEIVEVPEIRGKRVQ